MQSAAAIEFACPSCGHGLRVGADFAGRRSLCASCRVAITIPGAAADVSSTTAQTRSLSPLDAAAQACKAPAWEVAYSRAIIKAGADEAAVIKALGDRHVTVGSRMSSLPDIITARGIIGPDASRQAIVAARRASGGGVVTDDAKYIECPNCFGYVTTSDRRCPYCGEQLAHDDLLDICPNCKHQQPTGSDTCAACHANMRTGLLPSQSVGVCPLCGVRCEIGSTNCRTCGVRLTTMKAAKGAVRPGPLDAGRRRFTLPRSLASYVGSALVVALIAGVVWAFMHRGQLMHGESGAALRDSVDTYCEALKYQDYSALANLMDPHYNLAADAMPALMPVITSGEPGQEVLSIKSQTPKVEGESATVYVDIVLKGGDTSIAEATSIKTMEAINKVAGGSASKAKRVTWTWVQRDGAWYYAGPVP